MKLSLASLLLFSLAACGGTESSASSENAFSDSASHVWVGDIKSAIFTLDVAGSGAVPMGSECAPGAELYLVEFADGTVKSSACRGTPLRMVPRPVFQLSSQDLARLIDDSHAMQEVGGGPCDPSHRFVLLTMENEGSWTPVQNQRCLLGQAVTGLDALVDELDAIAEAQGFATVTMSPDAVPASLWTDPTSRLRLQFAGAGLLPTGWACAPGETHYLITKFIGRFQVSRNECITTDGGFMQMSSGVLRMLNDQDAAQLGSIFAASHVDTTSTCTPDAPYASLLEYPSSSGVAALTLLAAGTACTPGVDVGPFIDLSVLRTTLDSFFE